MVREPKNPPALGLQMKTALHSHLIMSGIELQELGNSVKIDQQHQDSSDALESVG